MKKKHIDWGRVGLSLGIILFFPLTWAIGRYIPLQPVPIVGCWLCEFFWGLVWVIILLFVIGIICVTIFFNKYVINFFYHNGEGKKHG